MAGSGARAVRIRPRGRTARHACARRWREHEPTRQISLPLGPTAGLVPPRTEVVVDFLGEGGATAEGVAMLRRAGDYHVVGYGENIDVPTIDVISPRSTSSATWWVPRTTSAT